jgi:hypothetical protein
MRTTLRPNLLALVGLFVIFALMGAALLPGAEAQDNDTQTAKPSAPESATEAIAQIKSDDGRLLFDVAEDMTRFVYDQSVVHEDGMPKHGSAFITQGYIYPAGTLTGSNGVNPDGSPEFPELVLGEWTCRGWFVGDGAHTKEGPMVITTQIYNFGPELGDATLVSEGYELADVGVYIERAITGGTGPYAYARGMGRQAFLGFNETQGVNLTYSLEVIGLSAPQPASAVND